MPDCSRSSTASHSSSPASQARVLASMLAVRTRIMLPPASQHQRIPQDLQAPILTCQIMQCGWRMLAPASQAQGIPQQLCAPPRALHPYSLQSQPENGNEIGPVSSRTGF